MARQVTGRGDLSPGVSAAVKELLRADFVMKVLGSSAEATMSVLAAIELRAAVVCCCDLWLWRVCSVCLTEFFFSFARLFACLLSPPLQKCFVIFVFIETHPYRLGKVRNQSRH